MFIGIAVTILFSIFYAKTWLLIENSKLANWRWVIPITFVALLVLTSVLPSITAAQTTDVPQDLDAFRWLQENTPEDAVVLAPYREGFLVNAIAERKNVLDENFILVQDLSQRLEDVETVYATSFSTQAIESLQRYNVSYIIISPETPYDELLYADETCFPLVYNQTSKIYGARCHLEEI